MMGFFTEVWPFSLLLNKKIKLPTAEVLVPEFELPEALSDGEYTYNPDYYATEPTAHKIMRRFNGLVVFKKAVQDVDRQAPAQWFIRFEDGAEVNAGQMGRFFAIYPESDVKLKGIAFRFALSYIALVREDKLRNE